MKKEKVKMILIIVFILSFFLVPSTFAIYKNSALTYSNLNLAEWSVSLNQDNENNYLSIIPDPENVTASYTLNITSNSEVDLTYSIVIDDLPSGVSVKLDDGTFISEINHQVFFNSAGSISYDDVNKTKSHVLTFMASPNAEFVDEHEVNINVIVSQNIS